MTTQNRVVIMGAGLNKSDLETLANWVVEATDVPEPSKLALFGIGLAGLLRYMRRRRAA